MAVEADLQTAGCYDEFVELIDDVRTARGMSFDQLEELSGIAHQHAQKALGPARAKPLSRMLLDALLPTLGVRIALVPDPEAIAAMQHRWEHRDESNVRSHHWRCSKRLLDRARPHILQEIIESLTAATAAANEQMKKQLPGREIRAEREAKIADALLPQIVQENAPVPRGEPASRSHLRVIQPARKGVRFGGAL